MADSRKPQADRSYALLLLRCVGTILLTSLMILPDSSAQSEEAVVVFRNTSISYKGGRLVTEEHIRMRIEGPDGNIYTRIELPYSDLKEISGIEAAVYTSSGDLVRKVKPKEINSRNVVADFAFYEQDYVKYFDLNYSQYPYFIEYKYKTETEQFLQIANWSPTGYNQMTCESGSISFDFPSDYGVRARSVGAGDSIVVENSGRRRMTWTVGQLPIDTQVQVVVLPLNFEFGGSGSFESWEAYGDWHFELNKSLNTLPDAEIFRITKLLEGIDDTTEIVRKLYAYLQENTRYVYVGLEIGGFKPYPADYVARNKYGDCKALANYFMALLEFKGIPSYYAIVRAGDDIVEIDTTFPFQQFNHAITFVPLSSGDMWLDCTTDMPYGYVSSFIQGRKALVIEEGRSRFEDIPGFTTSNSRLDRKFEFDVKDTRECTGTLTSTTRGDSYELLRQIDKTITGDDKREYVDAYMVPRGIHLQSLQVEDYQVSDTVITWTGDVSTTGILKKYGNEYFGLLPEMSLSRIDFDPDNPKEIKLSKPMAFTDTIIYDLPVGVALELVDEVREVPADFGSYHVELEQDMNSVSVIRRMILRRQNISKDKLEDFSTFVNRIIEENSRPIFTIRKT